MSDARPLDDTALGLDLTVLRRTTSLRGGAVEPSEQNADTATRMHRIRVLLESGDRLGAAEAYAQLLREDFVEFDALLVEDTSLTMLRDELSLKSLRTRLRARILELAPRGVPAHWEDSTAPGASRRVRVGFLVSGGRRFVPLTRAFTRRTSGDRATHLAAAYDPVADRVFVVDGTAEMTDMPALHGRLRVFLPLEYEPVSTTRLPTLGDYSVLLAGEPCVSGFDSSTGETPSYRLVGERPERVRACAAGPVLRIRQDSGAWVERETPSELRVEGNTLHVGERALALGDGHRVLRGTRILEWGGHVVVLSTYHQRSETDRASAFVLDQVDLSTGSVTRLDGGTGHAAIAVDGSGALLVDTSNAGHRVRRFARPGAEPELLGSTLFLDS